MILRTPFLINEYVIPACLPPSNIQLQKGLGVISGLGLTEDKTLSENLKLGEIEIIPGSKCKKTFQGDFAGIFNGVHMICGRGKNNIGAKVDSCQGEEINIF